MGKNLTKQFNDYLYCTACQLWFNKFKKFAKFIETVGQIESELSDIDKVILFK